MILNDALTVIAAQTKADAQALIAFAAEDTIGGYDIDEANRKFPMGSLWEPEGKILYALVRWLKPDVVVEVGGWVGCSASHLATAVKANGKGKVISVDSGEGGAVAGQLLLPDLREYVTFVKADGREWLKAQADHSIGLLFEDADHSTQLCKEIAELAMLKVEAGGVMVNHDAAHDFAIVGGGQRIGSPVGRAIRDGLEQAGVYFKPYLVEPSDCGVAITVIPGVRVDKHSVKVDVSPVRLMEQFGGSNSANGQGVITEVPQPIGNANIESLSTPPVIPTRVKVDAEAQEPDDPTTPKAQPKSKPRTRKK